MTPQEQLRAFRESQTKSLSPQEQLARFRASQSGGSSLGMARPKSFDELRESSTGKDLDQFDYTTGAGGGLRAALSFMETPEEKENLLRKKGWRQGVHERLKR